MKHGRRHDKLKEQAYVARKDAEGYATPYRPLDVGAREPEERATGPAPEAAEPLTLGAALGRRSKRVVRRAGVDADDGAASTRDG